MNEIYVVHLTADAENFQVAIQTSFNIQRVKYVYIYIHIHICKVSSIMHFHLVEEKKSP